MYDPYGDRQQRRAQRRYAREMRRTYRYQNPMRGLAGSLVIIALIIGFALSPTWGSKAFLLSLFIGLAFASLFGSFSTMSRNGIYSGFYGFIWLLGLGLCFVIGFWPWILLPVAVTMILGAMFRPILSGLGFLTATSMQPPGQQQPYPQQGQSGNQPQQQGYQGAPAWPHQANQENIQQSEQPRTPYPEQQQELPPMEQS